MRPLRNPRGITLIEIMCAVALLVSAAVVVSVFFQKVWTLSVVNNQRATAMNLANSKLENLKQTPFPLLGLTPATTFQGGTEYNQYFLNSPAGSCDCSKTGINFAAYPPAPPWTETVIEKGVTYYRRVCVDQVGPSPNASLYPWVSFCPNYGVNTGLKNVIVNVSWGANNSVSEDNMVYDSAVHGVNTSSGNVVVNVCESHGPVNSPDTTCVANVPALNGAAVAMYNGSGFVTEAVVASPPSSSVHLNIPPGAGYTLRVNLPNYSPYFQSGISISTSGAAFQAPMRSAVTYASQLSGEAFVADHPTIAMILSQANDSLGHSEVVQIYNPTPTTHRFGSGGDLKLAYYVPDPSGNGTFIVSTYDFSSRPPFTLNHPNVLPNTFSLIEATTTSVGFYGIAPDVSIDENSVGSLINYGAGGGGVRLLMNGKVVDSVRWADNNGNTPPGSGPDLYGPWEGDPFPNAPTLQAGYAAVRASRRGQVVYTQSKAPGWMNGWGSNYDSGSNATDFGVWHVSLDPWPLENSQSGIFPSYTGTPASSVYPQGTYIQIADPTSPVTLARDLNPPGDRHYTSQFVVPNVFGPSFSTGTIPAQWPVIVAAGLYTTPWISTGPISPPQMTLLNMGAPISPAAPPGAGGFDTDQLTINPTDYYGPGPADSYVPYVSLNTAGTWGLMRTQFLDSMSSGPVSGIAISVTDSHTPARFLPFEKIPDNSGNVTFLIPVTGTLLLGINNPTPVTGGLNTPHSHYYNPHYVSASLVTATPLTWNMTTPGVTNVATLTGSSVWYVNSQNDSNQSAATISGFVQSRDGNPSFNFPLPNVPVQLRDNLGRILATAMTGADGSFAFNNLADNSYRIVPQVDQDQVCSPSDQQMNVVNGVGGVAETINITGMPATVTVTDLSGVNSLVMVTTHSWINTAPPPISAGSSQVSAYFASTTYDGKGIINVPAGYSYYVTCWSLSGVPPSFHLRPSQPVPSAPYGVLIPMQNAAVTCL